MPAMAHSKRSAWHFLHLWRSLAACTNDQVKYLVGTGQYDINEKADTDQRTPLHQALDARAWEIAAFLLECKADAGVITAVCILPCDCDKRSLGCSQRGENCLHLAMNNNSEFCPALPLLLNTGRCDVNMHNDSGRRNPLALFLMV